MTGKVKEKLYTKSGYIFIFMGKWQVLRSIFWGATACVKLKAAWYTFSEKLN